MPEFGALLELLRDGEPQNFAAAYAYSGGVTATGPGPPPGQTWLVTDATFAGQSSIVSEVYGTLSAVAGSFVWARTALITSAGGINGDSWHGLLVVPHGSSVTVECIVAASGVYAACSVSGLVLPYAV